MKVAISSPDGKFDTPFSARFARCEHFIFVDTETRNWEATPNNGVKATISGRYGPTAFSALNAAGIQAFVADGGTPAELLDEFLADELAQVNTATGQARHHS